MGARISNDRGQLASRIPSDRKVLSISLAAIRVDAYPLPPVALAEGIRGDAAEDEQMLELLRRLGYLE